MIGFWNYTVILTFLSLASSVLGMTEAMEGHFTLAIIFLALSGLFDSFDGRVARMKKDRSNDEKTYGIQLDSLCDMVCFGAFPALLCYQMGISRITGTVIMVLYCMFAVVRLAYYNVLEMREPKEENESGKYFHGLPVTSIAAIFPLVYLVSYWVSGGCKSKVLESMLLVTGVLFVVDFKVKKPSFKQLMCLVIIVAVALIVAVYLYHWSKMRSLL